MTSYIRTMREALEEMHQNLNEDNLDKMRKAAAGAKQTLKMKDGSIGMDSFTASAIMQIYDKINDKNKKTLENMMKNGKKADIMKLAKFAMSKVNAEYVPEEFEEEFELDEKVQFEAPTKDGNTFQIIDRDTKGMAGKQDKFKMQIVDKRGKVIKDLGSHASLNGAKGMAKNRGIIEEVELDEGKMSAAQIAKLKKAYEPMRGKKISMASGQKLSSIMDKVDDDKQALIQLVKADIPFVSQLAVTRLITKHGMKGAEIRKMQEEVELDEAKYDLYHKDFSSAMQHAYKMAKKMYGITVDPKEIDDKVASGPRKPSEGKTNSYRLKGDKGAIQVQVYNKGGSKPFELNMYKEEVELDEAKQKPYVSSDRDGKHVMNASGEIAKSFKDMDSANAYLKKNYNKLMKEKLDKEDEPTVKAVVKMLKKASNAHAGQAKDLEKAVKEDSENEGFASDAQRRAAFASGYKEKGKKKKNEGAIGGLIGGAIGAATGGPVGAYKGMKIGSKVGDAASTAAKVAGAAYLAKKGYDAAGKKKKEPNNEGTINEILPALAGTAVRAAAPYVAGYALRKIVGDGKDKKKGNAAPNAPATESAASDARRAMASDPSTKQKFSKNVSATDDDVKAADKNIIMQMRKAVSLRGNKVEFMDKKKVMIPQKIAQAVITKYNNMKKPADKEKFQSKISKSYKSMLATLKEQNEINNKNNSLVQLKELVKEMKGKNNG